MANHLGEDLTDRVVIIDAKHLVSELDSPERRAFRVNNGFGAKSHTYGSAIIGEFLFDGKRCRMEGWMVERFATDDEIKDSEAMAERGPSG